MQQQTVMIGNDEVRWMESGTGMPVLLVHGIPTSPDLWRGVLPLVRGGRCLALEMLGYGTSMRAREGRDISVAAQAERLLAWIDTLGIRRAILVGHDLGGGVVQIAATHRPSIVAALLLTNSIAYDSWPIPSVKIMRGMGALIRHLPARVVKMMVAPLFARGHDDRATARESRELHWSRYAADGGGAALIDQMNALDVNDTIAIAGDLTKLRGVPARVIWGASDAFQKIKYGERLARDLGAQLERIEGGKHFTPEDHPDVIARAINDLIAQTSLPGQGEIA